jgi:hypothetical protein
MWSTSGLVMASKARLLYDWRFCSNCSAEAGKKAAGSAQAASADGLQAHPDGQRDEALGR